MRPFRFRAQAALLLRRKEEDVARQDLARAERAREAAQARAEAAAATVRQAAEAAHDARQRGVEAWRVDWHRSWITRKQLEADAGRRAAAVSAEAAGHAAAEVTVAYQRRRALERLRERAWRRYQLEVTREEGRAMNELAGLRFLALADSRGETDDED
jgi:flagellar export protein FliJ